MDIERAKQVIQNAIDGRPNSCISEHYRGLKEVYELLIALDMASEASASAVVADAPRPPPRLKPYLISVTLQDTFLATDSDEAWDMAIDRIASRTGMNLVDHKIEEPEDDGI